MKHEAPDMVMHGIPGQSASDTTFKISYCCHHLFLSHPPYPMDPKIDLFHHNAERQLSLVPYIQPWNLINTGVMVSSRVEQSFQTPKVEKCQTVNSMDMYLKSSVQLPYPWFP